MKSILNKDKYTGKRVRHVEGDIPKIGTILGSVIWGSQRQYLVDFGFKNPEYLDRSEIRFLKDPYSSLSDGTISNELYRLKTWASILKSENIGTMSLSKMTLDILPHQLEVAHRALETPADGFLIADGVGLGKTIEAGMIIQSMIYRGDIDDILIICPAKLMRQWKEQMMHKFDTYFALMGGDYGNHSEDPRAFWEQISKVIASMETLRQDVHKAGLIASGKKFDLVVVDEAHRLSSYEYDLYGVGDTLSYKLLKDLRPSTEFFLFLTATPHQGDENRFYKLLELLDPSYINNSPELSINDDKDINELIVRNDKDKVTDRDDELLFKGHDTEHRRFKPKEEYVTFLEKLENFINLELDSYMGSGGRGKGFLKSTLMKLANSSPQAIKNTFEKNYQLDLQDMNDEGYEGEIDEKKAQEGLKDKDDVENGIMNELLLSLEQIESMGRFEELQKIIDEYIDDQEKLLIFTEYRKTQEHIKNKLSKIYSSDKIEILNGSMNTNQKYDSIKRFNSKAKFLISTEAGGEGLDMHQECHIMVNYDIPWNPMRLYQRTGRLDRYGQEKRVLRFDIIAQGTIDDKITTYLEEKMDIIKESLSGLEGEAIDSLAEKVLGHLRIDEEDITRYYLEEDEDTKDKIDREIEKEVDMRLEGEKILNALRGISPDDYKMEETKYGLDSLEDFVLSYLEESGIEFKNEDEGIYLFNTPEEIKNIEFYEGELINNKCKITFDRKKAQEESNLNLFGFGENHLDAMIDINIFRIDGEFGKLNLKVEDSSYPKQGFLISYVVRNEVNGKLRFEGVEYYFVKVLNDHDVRLVDDDGLIDFIISNIIEKKYENNTDFFEKIDEDVLEKSLNEVEREMRRVPRGGKLGGALLSSIAWIEFVKNGV